MKSKTKKKIEYTFNYFAIFCGIIIFIYGFQTVWIGYHNVDMGWNMRLMEEWFNTTLYDYTNTGKYLTGLEGVNLGYNQMQYGFYFSLLGAYLIGLMLGSTYMKAKKSDADG